MITGEALMGILMAIPIVVYRSADVLALPDSWHFGQWLGIVFLAALAVWLYRTATTGSGEANRAEVQSRRT